MGSDCKAFSCQGNLDLILKRQGGTNEKKIKIYLTFVIRKI